MSRAFRRSSGSSAAKPRVTISGQAFDLAGALVDGDDGQDDAVSAEMCWRSRMTMSSTTSAVEPVSMQTRPTVILPTLVGAVAVEVEHVAVFEQDDLLEDARGAGEFGVALEVAVVAVDGDEELWAQQVDHQAQLFLRAVAADVDEAVGAVVVDDVGVAALEVVDHAVDGLLVAGDDARAEDHGVAGVDLGVLVVVDGGAGERGHGLALGAGDHDQSSLSGIVA